MYNVKGPSKIVAKTTRRGITQNLDTFTREHSRSKSVNNNNEDSEDFNGPRPVFNNMAKKQMHIHRQHKELSPHHKEIVKYVHEAWQTACSELEQHTPNSDGSSSPDSEHSVLYYEDDPCPHLQDFKPFDLESWWGRRLYTHIISNSLSTKG